MDGMLDDLFLQEAGVLETLRHDQLLGSSKVEKRRAARAEHTFARQEARKLTQEDSDRQRAEQLAAAKNGLRAWKVEQAREALERRSAVQGQALSLAPCPVGEMASLLLACVHTQPSSVA